MGRTRGIHQISINNPQKSAGFESHHRITAFCHNPSSNQLLLAPKYTMLIKPSNFSDKAQDHKTKDNCARPTTKHVKVYQALVRQIGRPFSWLSLYQITRRARMSQDRVEVNLYLTLLQAASQSGVTNVPVFASCSLISHY